MRLGRRLLLWLCVPHAVGSQGLEMALAHGRAWLCSKHCKGGHCHHIAAGYASEYAPGYPRTLISTLVSDILRHNGRDTVTAIHLRSQRRSNVVDIAAASVPSSYAASIGSACLPSWAAQALASIACGTPCNVFRTRGCNPATSGWRLSLVGSGFWPRATSWLLG